MTYLLLVHNNDVIYWCLCAFASYVSGYIWSVYHFELKVYTLTRVTPLWKLNTELNTMTVRMNLGHHDACSLNCRRISLRSILPLADLGIAFTKVTPPRRRLKLAACSEQITYSYVNHHVHIENGVWSI